MIERRLYTQSMQPSFNKTGCGARGKTVCSEYPAVQKSMPDIQSALSAQGLPHI